VTSTLERIRVRLFDIWPDVYVASLAAFGALVVLINRDGSDRVSIGKVLPHAAADIYLAATLIVAGGLIAFIVRKDAVRASWCASALGSLLALNGCAVFIASGSGSVYAMCAYYMAAALLINRSFVLARGVVVPRWRDPHVYRPPTARSVAWLRGGRR
jgi:hypothetical protein